MKFVFRLTVIALTVLLTGPILQAESFTLMSLPLIARGLNNAGQVVGYGIAGETTYGVLYSQGALSTLRVPGSRDTLAFGINNQSQIAGYYTGPGDYGFLDNNGLFTSLQVPGSAQTRAQGLNDQGQVVGYYLNSVNGNSGFLYEAGTYPYSRCSRCAQYTSYGH